jgi:uncharacterized protein YjiS (DUF1127 family)
MSTLSNLETNVVATHGGFASPGATLKRWWVAYVTWRVHRLSIAHLRSMSDRELRDIGVARSEIESAVTGRVKVFGRHR